MTTNASGLPTCPNCGRTGHADGLLFSCRAGLCAPSRRAGVNPTFGPAPYPPYVSDRDVAVLANEISDTIELEIERWNGQAITSPMLSPIADLLAWWINGYSRYGGPHRIGVHVTSPPEMRAQGRVTVTFFENGTGRMFSTHAELARRLLE